MQSLAQTDRPDNQDPIDGDGLITDALHPRLTQEPLGGEFMESSFLAIDFETANQSRDSACSVGLVRVENAKIVHQSVHLIRPPYRDFIFTYIHGISWSDVAREPDFKALWKVISPLFKGIGYLAAHNASFDSSVLRACTQRYGISTPDLPFTCSMKLARSQWELRPTKLPDVCRHLGIELKHHDALSDALACAQIVMAADKERASEKSVPDKKATRAPAKVILRRGATAATRCL